MKKNSMKKNRTRIVSIVMAASLFMTSGTALAQEAPQAAEALTAEEQEINAVIRDFFETYENINLENNTEQIMSGMEALSAAEPVQAYREQESAVNAISSSGEEESYLEMAELLLERREIIENTSDIDLKEYQKEIELETGSIEIDNMTANADVRVVRSWYYSFSPEIESAAADDFQITLTKEDGEWKIQDVKGLENVVGDPDLARMGSAITRAEKEAYLNDVAEYYSYDLENPVVTKKKAASLASALEYDYEREDPKGYSPALASEYALEYAIDPNPEYPTYETYDGTNFVSQCLYEGGILMRNEDCFLMYAWYYENIDDYSFTWVDPEKFNMHVRSTYTCFNTHAGIWETAEIGDIVHLMDKGKAYHTMFITGVAYGSSGKSDLLICAHDANRRHVSLAIYFDEDIKNYTLVYGNR